MKQVLHNLAGAKVKGRLGLSGCNLNVSYKHVGKRVRACLEEGAW